MVHKPAIIFFLLRLHQESVMTIEQGSLRKAYFG